MLGYCTVLLVVMVMLWSGHTQNVWCFGNKLLQSVPRVSSLHTYCSMLRLCVMGASDTLVQSHFASGHRWWNGMSERVWWWQNILPLVGDAVVSIRLMLREKMLGQGWDIEKVVFLINIRKKFITKVRKKWNFYKKLHHNLSDSWLSSFGCYRRTNTGLWNV